MSKFTIFKENYSSLFTIYGHGVDTIQHILESLGYNLLNIHNDGAKREALLAIKQLLKYNVIEITYLGNKPFIKNELKLVDIILEIDKLWATTDKSKIDFELIVNFKYQDWYLSKMREIPIDLNTDWEWFAKEFIPNMKQWILENEPKKNTKPQQRI